MQDSEVVIAVHQLSKRYRIGASGESQRTLRETITTAAKEPFRRLLAVARGQPAVAPTKTIWALHEVSFEIKRGEVVGIIGRNGSGKTTLLKILSRITDPTRGWAKIQGRVGSLLEVGTGFHPELTGRENVYLNGAILGMKRGEVRRKFDQIVEFSGNEAFIDTPIKHYSSGMYVRLAFAVAAHLEPDILVVDEVLAVGDIDFQKKCIGSMESVARSGRTVLLVSHNMALIDSLCGDSLWLDQGELQDAGATSEVLAGYLAGRSSVKSERLADRARDEFGGQAKFSDIRILADGGSDGSEIPMGTALTFRLSITAEEVVQQPWIGIQLRTEHDHLVFHMANREAGFKLPPIRGACEVCCTTGELNLLPGRYFVDLILGDMAETIYDKVAAAAWFDIRSTDVFSSAMPMGKEYGLCYFPSRWELTPGDSTT